MIRDFEYSEGDALALGVGDVLLAFTDGFVEARSIDAPDDLFDEAGMRRILSERGAAGATARELTEALVQAALEHAQGNSEDDQTVVAIRRTQ
jgi:serine phosphatase RsbU (regulator of sigma subunit)